MSATTAQPTPGPAELPTLDISGTPRTPFGRLVRVEARKMVDTRAGFWLLLVTFGLLLVATVITLLVTLLNDVSITAEGWVQVMTVPLSLLLPVCAITTVTAEWSQRTGLVTFAHEPHRMRVIAAKLITVVGLVLVAMVAAVVLGAIGNLIYGAFADGGATWTIDWGNFAWTVISQVLYFLMAFGFGMVILNSPGSIALYYVVALLLPLMVWGPVYALVSWGPDVIPWIDMNFAQTPFVTDAGSIGPNGQPVGEITGTNYAQVVVSAVLWVVLPLALGWRRVSRAEIK